MLKKYNNLWVFGDSYSTPNYCVDPQDSFWGLTGKCLSATSIYNYSWTGNSLDSIIHVLISCQAEYNWKDDFFLIGIPPLARLTVVSLDDKKITTGYRFDTASWSKETFNVLCHHGMANIQSREDKKFAIHEDSTWTQIQAMRNIFLLSSWLESKNANYLIVNLSKNLGQDNSSVGDFLMTSCQDNPKSVIFKNSLYDVNLNINKPVDFDKYGWYGHHGAAGNKYFFEKSVLPALEKNNLI